MNFSIDDILGIHAENAPEQNLNIFKNSEKATLESENEELRRQLEMLSRCVIRQREKLHKIEVLFNNVVHSLIFDEE